MHPNSDKNVGLMRQFPFIRGIVSEERLSPRAGDPVCDLDIRVQRADGDLLYRQAQNVGLGSQGYLNGHGTREGLRGQRLEYILAVDGNDATIGYLSWTEDADERRGKPEIYARAVLDGAITEKVRCLVWVTLERWYENGGTDKSSGRFGALRHRSASVTVYQEPKEGFRNLMVESSFVHNGRITNDVISRGISCHDENVSRVCGMLDVLCLDFRDDVLLNGMLDVLAAAGYSRHAVGQFGAVEVSCGWTTMGGGDLITLRDSVCSVEFFRREGKNTVSINWMNGTFPQLRALVRTVIAGWRLNPQAFKPVEPSIS